jgi:hypothetical protein
MSIVVTFRATQKITTNLGRVQLHFIHMWWKLSQSFLNKKSWLDYQKEHICHLLTPLPIKRFQDLTIHVSNPDSMVLYLLPCSERIPDAKINLVWKIYRYWQTTVSMNNHYEKLITVAVEVLATPCWKHVSQVSVLDSSSSHAVESTVYAIWTLCLHLRFHFTGKEYYIFTQVVYFLRSNAFSMTSRTAINYFLDLWCHPHIKLYVHTYTLESCVFSLLVAKMRSPLLVTVINTSSLLLHYLKYSNKSTAQCYMLNFIQINFKNCQHNYNCLKPHM